MTQNQTSVGSGKAAYLVAQARHAEHMARHHEASAYWFAAANAVSTENERVQYIRLSERAQARSLAGAA